MDYRMIPEEKLNSNIPKGRGMIKWAPFATMPEQFENVHMMIENQNRIERPELTDDRLQYIDQVLKFAFKEKRPVNIQYFYDGQRMDMTMMVARIDPWSMHVIGTHLEDNSNVVFLPFMDILDVWLA